MVISDNCEFAAVQIRAEFTQCQNEIQTLAFSDRILALSRGKKAAAVGNNTFLPLFLRQDRSNFVAPGIGTDFCWILVIKVSENRSGGKQPDKLGESTSLLSAPNRLSLGT